MNAATSIFDARKRRLERAEAAVSAYPWTGNDPITAEECEQSRRELMLLTTPGLSPANSALKIDRLLWWYAHRPPLRAALVVARDALLAGDVALAARAFDWFMTQPASNLPLADFDLSCLLVLFDDLQRLQRLSA